MDAYLPPLDDVRFGLRHLADLPGLLGLEAFDHVDPALVDRVLDEYGRFLAEVVAPLDRVGDREGATRHDDGSVTTPAGFTDAYRRYVDAGWGAVPFPVEYGGGGFPWLVGIAMQELLTAANMSFSLCPLLTQGAIDMLLQHGSEEQRQRYVPRMVTGEWAGTMNLTEPRAGSDLGALGASAEPAGDGSWRVRGTKIFITYGEHDQAGNIVHLVLARAPGAPPGTRGISCFVVPKFLTAADGSVGDRNDVACVSIERKLGIHASPTCQMAYGDAGGAVAELVGEAHRGMRYMFTMMNTARLSVGLQGLALADRAYQRALAHALERRQGRPPGASSDIQVPIVAHPDVRRMLLTMRSTVEALRGLVYLVAESIDLARHHPEAAVRQERQELVDLLTPVAKAFTTDQGVELTSLALQVHGGMGYIEETGVAQHLRDARIAPIYEGTNGIQAADLVGRKLPLRDGAVVGDHLARIAALDAPLARVGDELAGVRASLADALSVLREATHWMQEHGVADPDHALAGSTPYLGILGWATCGWMMARQALAACRILDGDAAGGDGGRGAATGEERARAEAKLATARFFCEQLVPRSRGLLPAVTAGAGQLFAVPPERLR